MTLHLTSNWLVANVLEVMCNAAATEIPWNRCKLNCTITCDLQKIDKSYSVNFFPFYFLFYLVYVIGVAPITQVTHMRTKTSNTQGRSPYAIKVIFLTIRKCS